MTGLSEVMPWRRALWRFLDLRASSLGARRGLRLGPSAALRAEARGPCLRAWPGLAPPDPAGEVCFDETVFVLSTLLSGYRLG